MCDLVPSYVTPEPDNSVLLLADFSNAQIDRDALEHVKLAAVFDRPHLKRSAWVITPSFPKAFYENVRAFSVRELHIFQTRGQALRYLIGEDEEETQELAPPAYLPLGSQFAARYKLIAAARVICGVALLRIWFEKREPS
jgi:hypothetical protein